MSAAPLILIDGSSYLYRAFHALPPLANSRGEPTGAVFGVLNMLRKFLQEQPDCPMVVVFDAPGKTFRDDLFAEYKAHRPPMPDDLRSQIEPLLAAVTAMGLPLLRITGVEADDVIGTLARRAADAGKPVLISTGDKDMAQLVDEHITLINTMSNTRMDRAGVKAKFDVWPEQIIDYLALIGDSSDNIPGIEKVGPKTAAKWLATYGTIDKLLLNAEQISGVVGENLRKGLDTLALSRRLATIRLDLDLPISVDGFARGPQDIPALRALYERMEFRGLLRALEGDAPGHPWHGSSGAIFARCHYRSGAADRSAAAGCAQLHDDSDAGAIRRLAAAPANSRAGCLRHRDHQPRLSRGAHRRRVVLHRRRRCCISAAGRTAMPARRGNWISIPLWRDLKPWLEDAARAKVGHHLKYDAHVLRNHGIHLAGMRYDSMLESYVWNSVASRHDMDSLAQMYLGVTTVKYEDVAGKGAKQIGFDQVPVEIAANYAAEDADITLQLHQAFWSKLRAEPRLRALYEELEQPLVDVLLEMEQRGVLLDTALLRKQSGEIGAQAGRIAEAGPCGCRRRVQCRIAKAAAADPVRETAVARQAQDAHRAALHCRGCARGTCRGLRAAATDPRIPRTGQA